MGNSSDGSQWRDAVRAATPSWVPRTHILREAARFVELDDNSGRLFLDALRDALEHPFDTEERRLAATWDSPREAWRGINMRKLDEFHKSKDVPLAEWLRERLQAL